MREQSSKYDLCQVVYDETIEDGFHGFATNTTITDLLQLSVRLASRFGATELRYFSQSSRRENIQNRVKPKTKHGKSLKKFVVQVQRQKLQLKTWLRAGLVASLKVPRLKNKLIWNSTF